MPLYKPHGPWLNTPVRAIPVVPPVAVVQSHIPDFGKLLVGRTGLSLFLLCCNVVWQSNRRMFCRNVSGLNAVKCNLKELTTKSTWVPRLAHACSVAGHIDHVIPWRVLSAIFFVFFLGVFLLCEQFFTVVVDFAIFRCFSVCFFEGLVHMPRNMVNRISASLDPSSSSDESALSTTSNSTSSSSFTSSPSSVAISAETLSQAISQTFQQSLPQILAALRENGAPNSTSSSTSGNPSVAPFTTSVLSTYTSTPTACRSSSSPGSMTVPSFLSTYSSVSHGFSCFSAARPGIVGTILVRSYIGTVDQQPDLGAFGRKSVCSWPRLCANSGETGGQNNQWHLH